MQGGGEASPRPWCAAFFLPGLFAPASVPERSCCFLPQEPPGIRWVPGPTGPVFSVPVHVAVTVLCAFGHHCPQHPILVAGHIGLWQEPGT